MRRNAWGAGTASTALVVFAVLFFPFTSPSSNSFTWLWVPVQLAAFLESCLVAFVALKLLPRRFWSRSWSGISTNLLLAASVGIQENFFVWNLADSLKIVSEPATITEKVLGGTLLGVGILSVWVSISAVLRTHRASILDLLTNSSRLLNLKSGLSAQVEIAQKALIEQTQRTLLPKLDEVSRLLADIHGARLAIEQLKQLIEVEIRPLTRQFQLASRLSVTGLTHDDIDEMSGVRFPAQFSIYRSLKPGLSWLLALPLQMDIWIYFFSPVDYLKLLGAFVLNYSILIGAKQIRRRLLWRRVYGVVVVSLLAIASVVPQWFIYQEYIHNGSQLGGAILACGFAALCVVWNTLVNAALTSQKEIERLLNELNKRIDRELSYFNQSLWLQKRRWGYLLHGNVQATLTVAIARLSQVVLASGSEKLSGEAEVTLTLVASELKRVAHLISNPHVQDLDIQIELESLRATWAGVLDVELDASEESWQALRADENLAMATNEICREAATNAYRHGGADSLRLQISLKDGQFVEIIASNNGSSPKSVASGLGSEMLDAVTHDWSLGSDTQTGLVVLKIVLALPS
jgi:signal transduction histidine kinase